MDSNHGADVNTLIRLALATPFMSIAIAVTAPAQQPPPPASEVGASQLALVQLAAPSTPKLSVRSPAFKSMGDIPMENTQYAGNVFPGLAWTAGPRSTRSYAIIMQDADAMRGGEPILHWTMVNLPATTRRLDRGMTTAPTGSQFGPNIRGMNQAYMGPHTPAGPKHRYHLQLFALDTTIPVGATADYGSLIAAMQGHVVASGDIVGLGQAPANGPGH
jgi:para-nitrobenzyl esterase